MHVNTYTCLQLQNLRSLRTFENPDPQPVPLQFLVGAANRVPEEPELAPFVDRFIFRPWVPYTRSDKNKALLIEWACDGNQPQVTPDQISLANLDHMKTEAMAVTVSSALRDEYLKAIKALEQAGFAISDRRIIQLLKLLKCYAYVQGSSAVYIDHLQTLLPFCLWLKEASEINAIKKQLDQACPHPKKLLKDWLKLAQNETQAALAQEDLDHIQPYLERATQQLVNVERQITELQSKAIANIPDKRYQVALNQLEELRLELAEAKDSVFS